jgi:L-fuconolactonase
MSERIDAHHHLWCYKKEDYRWISEEMKALACDFLPKSLEEELATAGVDGAISVQARQSLEETHWLLEKAKESSCIRGVVGWAPLASSSFPEVLEELKEETRLKGLRHVIQDEPDAQFISGKDFNRGMKMLSRSGLVYDILIYERQLPEAIQLVDRYPAQLFVLDHIAKPRIKERVLEPWRRNLRELSRRENVYCKLSGMVTEAHWTNWTNADLYPYFEVALEAFGPGRLMVGSDWPVCLLACSYQKWTKTVQEWIKPLSCAERDMILGTVASQVYSLAKVSREVIS